MCSTLGACFMYKPPPGGWVCHGNVQTHVHTHTHTHTHAHTDTNVFYFRPDLCCSTWLWLAAARLAFTLFTILDNDQDTLLPPLLPSISLQLHDVR